MKTTRLKLSQKIGIAFLILVLLFAVLHILFFALMMYVKVIRPALTHYPADQSESKWASEDGRISFQIDKVSKLGYGTMVLDDGSIVNIIFFAGVTDGKTITIYANIDEEQEKIIETWYGDFIRKDRFTATVRETTYFEVGQKITFHRVDEDKDTT